MEVLSNVSFTVSMVSKTVTVLACKIDGETKVVEWI